jgi:hypothetical protein
LNFRKSRQVDEEWAACMEGKEYAARDFDDI